MTDNNFAVNSASHINRGNVPERGSSAHDLGRTEPVAIDASRVYDSCGDKDCLSDIRVFFTSENQALINNAINVRVRDVDVLNVSLDLEPVLIHRGFYSIDMVFYFDVSLDVFVTPGGIPNTVNGLSIFSKRVILYGSEGNVKIFSSDLSINGLDAQNFSKRNLPKASVQVASPIALAAKLKESCGLCSPPCNIPKCICQYYGGEMTTPSNRTVFVTIGLFTIVQIERNVQVLVPSYEFRIPEKECVTSSDNPCEMFGRIDFPTNEFFPPQVIDLKNDDKLNFGSCKK